MNDAGGRLLIAEPAWPRHISGGYRYNSAVGRELRRRGQGGLRQFASIDTLIEHLAGACDATVCIDSLWLGEPLSSRQKQQLTATPCRFVILGHYLPPANPLLSEASKTVWLDSARGWLALCDRVMVTGISAAKTWSRLFPQHDVCVLPPAITSRRRATIDPSGPLRLLSVGTITPAKLPLELLNTMGRLRRKNFCWTIVGYLGSHAAHVANCRRALRNEGLGGCVELIGELPASDVESRLAGADIYLATSQFESFGMATAEALSVGLPVIAFNVGDVGRWLPDDPACRVLAAGDFNSFVDCLDQWLSLDRDSLPAPGLPALPVTNWEALAQRFAATAAP